MIQKYGQINDASVHVIADFFEIISFNESRSISRSDIETHLIRDAGEGTKQEVAEDATGDTSAESNEKYQKLSEEVFSHLRYRQTAFKKWYPFTADKDVLDINKKLSDRHKLYIALLLFSRLQMMSRSNRTKLAAVFEKLCYFAIVGMFPNWEIIHFGKGGLHRKHYGNKLKDALRALADKIKDNTDSVFIEELSEHDSGDAGIDIIALNHFGDSAQGVALYFGQCAAQQDGWPDKVYEAHEIKLSKYFNFFHSPGTLLFIPLFYRKLDGRWVTSHAYNSILLDRLRLVELFEAQKANCSAAIAATIKAIPMELFRPGGAPAKA